MKNFITFGLFNTLFISIVLISISLHVLAGESIRNAKEITITATEFNFEPAVITVQKGQDVNLVFKNKGVMTHNLTIDKLGLKTETIQPDETSQLNFTAEKKGIYPFQCNVPGHKQAGMRGKIIIE